MEKKEKVKYSWLTVEKVKYRTLLTKKYEQRIPYSDPETTLVKSFISGNIHDVKVKKNQKVKIGDELLILEAMKMRNKIIADQDGVIKMVHVQKGENVIKGQLLVEYK